MQAEKTDALTEWAQKKPGAPWDYPGVTVETKKMADLPALLRGYNIARHHVAALLKAEEEAEGGR